MQVRQAVASDAAAVVALWTDSPDVLPTHTDDVAAVEALIARDADSLLVACDRERVVGTLIIGWDGWRGNLYRLAVHPGARRRGVATTLVAHVVEALAAKGCRRIAANVARDADQAHAFWHAAGFEPNSTDARFVKNC